MELKEAIAIQQHLIHSYVMGQKLKLGNISGFANTEFQKNIESCKIAISLMENAMNSQKDILDKTEFSNKMVSAVVDNRLYNKALREAEESENEVAIKTINAMKVVADLHKISFGEFRQMIVELGAITSEVEE